MMRMEFHFIIFLCSRYSPPDPVKRPGSGEKVYDVLRKMNPDISYGKEKEPGAWATKIVKFEPENTKIRPFDSLRNRLRQEKKLPPMPEKSVGQRKDYWGKIVTHYKVGNTHTIQLHRCGRRRAIKKLSNC